MRFTLLFLCLFVFFGCKTEQKESYKRAKLWLDDTSIDSDSIDYLNYTTTNLEERLTDMGLIDVAQLEPSIKIDLKYSTTDNFLHIDLYEDFNSCYLQPEVAEKLQLAQLFLKSKYPNYSLIVYDAVRPRGIQWKMWNILDMPAKEKSKYVSNPRNGSLHNFGAAVDVSIIDEFGEELNMATPYDFFGELAYPRLEKKMLAAKKLSPKQLKNRKLLRKVMENSGFMHITTEWWHFNSCYRTEARKKYQIIE